MEPNWWMDEELTELRREHVRTLAVLELLSPDPNNLLAEYTEPAGVALREAFAAEAAYDGRRRELGLLE